MVCNTFRHNLSYVAVAGAPVHTFLEFLYSILSKPLAAFPLNQQNKHDSKAELCFGKGRKY